MKNVVFGDIKPSSYLGDFNAKTVGNESLHKSINDNAVRVENSATSKNLSRQYNVPTW
jgi:hypothetical protein